MKEVLDLSIEPEIKEILDDHSDKIQKLEVDMAGVKEKLSSIEGTVTRFENNYYQTSSSILQTMSQLVVNTSKDNVEIAKTNADIEKTKTNNKKEIALKVLGILCGVVGGFFLAKYGVHIVF